MIGLEDMFVTWIFPRRSPCGVVLNTTSSEGARDMRGRLSEDRPGAVTERNLNLECKSDLKRKI